MNKKHKDFREYLLERLQDPQFALGYLNEALTDEDERVFLLALKNVIEAQGGDMTAIAQEAELNRQNIYRMLSEKGNPKFTSLRSLLGVLGLQLTVQQIKNK